MSEGEPSTSAGGEAARARGRGRGKSRGGLGKYLRARGRGRGGGRPAEWGKRLVLEDEEQAELDDEEARELQQKFARRQLGSNADRYVEPEPELDSEGEEIVEPEVDLSAFLERQRLSPQESSAPPPPDEDDDVDESLAQYTASTHTQAPSKKGRVQQVEWDATLEEMRREKAAADATRDLKARFREQTTRQRGRPAPRAVAAAGRGRGKQPERAHLEAPPLPTDAPKPEKGEKEQMQDFLDDLLG